MICLLVLYVVLRVCSCTDMSSGLCLFCELYQLILLQYPFSYASSHVSAHTQYLYLCQHPGPGGETMFAGSGTIIGCEDVNGKYTSTILTSATLLRSTESNAIQEDIEVVILVIDVLDTLRYYLLVFNDLRYCLSIIVG